METQSNGSVKPPVRDGIVEGVKYSGWLFRFVSGGWFRKRWVKKWAVLMDERIYLYDSQSINNNETKNCNVINLLLCENCGNADEKDAKKKPHSFLLQMKKSYSPPSKNKSKKGSVKIPRELFNSESEEEKVKWLEKLNEALKEAKQAEKTNLDHVTKSRAKPRAVQRRPPSRQHIRQLATQSQLLPGIDIDYAINEEPVSERSNKSKGTVPTTALKPPSTAAHNDAKEEEKTESKDAGESSAPDTTSEEEKPVPNPRRRNTLTPDLNEETDGSVTPIRSPSPRPPPTPSKSLKPKLVKSTEDLREENGDVTTSTDGSKPDEQPKSLSLPHVLPLKFPGLKPTAAPRSTKSLDRRDLFDHSKTRSAPSSLMVKSSGDNDTRAMLLKAKALKLPAFPEANPPIAVKRGKSRSMTLLDRYGELPPPPEPPMMESVSDIETNSDHVRVQKMQQKKKKRERSKSNPNTTDEEEEEVHQH